MDLYFFNYLLIATFIYSLVGLGIYRFFITPKNFKEGLTAFFANMIAFLLIYRTGNILLWFITSAFIIPIIVSLAFKSFTKWSLIKYIIIIIIIVIILLFY
ncbi:MAG: hypothetical protein ACO2ON_01585 [Candidatus Nanopusillus sp.]